MKIASSAPDQGITRPRESSDPWVSASLRARVTGTATIDAKQKEIPPQHQNITTAGTENVQIVAASAAKAASRSLPPALRAAVATNHGAAASAASTPRLKKTTFHPIGAKRRRMAKSLLSIRLTWPSG